MKNRLVNNSATKSVSLGDGNYPVSHVSRFKGSVIAHSWHAAKIFGARNLSALLSVRLQLDLPNIRLRCGRLDRLRLREIFLSL